MRLNSRTGTECNGLSQFREDTDNAFQIIHIHTTVVNSGRAHTTQHRTHCEAEAALGS